MAETNNPATTDSIVCDLSAFGGLIVTGADTRSFLQGQFTNDVNLVSDGAAKLCAWCSPKGRVLLSFWLFQHGDGLCLLPPTTLDQSLVTRLRMFVLRAKVKLDTLGQDYQRAGCMGQAAVATLQTLYNRLPTEPGHVVERDDGVSILRTLGCAPRFELVGPASRITATVETLGQHCRRVDTEVWSALDIEAGLPLVHGDTADQYLPQMLNLMELGAINLNKGCYVGQEIVARAHYRGTIKRCLLVAHCSTETPPARGEEVISINEDGSKNAGKVIAAAMNATQSAVVQAVISTEMASDSLALSDGRALTPVELSYLTQGH